MVRRTAAALSALAAAAAASPVAAHACAVCYGDAGGDVIGGARLAVIFMLGLTYTVVIGGVATAVVVRRRHARQPASGATPRPPAGGVMPFRGVNDGSTARPS